MTTGPGSDESDDCLGPVYSGWRPSLRDSFGTGWALSGTVGLVNEKTGTAGFLPRCPIYACPRLSLRVAFRLGFLLGRLRRPLL